MRLSKYVGLKNDFIVTNTKEITESGFSLGIESLQEIAKQVCDRNDGIGADDLMVLGEIDETCPGYREFIGTESADCLMYLINPDGSIAEMSGNGSRCFALYAREQGYGKTDDQDNYTLKMATLAGLKTITYKVVEDNRFYGKTDMNVPIFEADQIPLENSDAELKVEVLGKERISYAVNTGIPHWVIPLDSQDELNSDALIEQGLALRYDKRFPANTNVNFIYIKNDKKIFGRTFERGVGETFACGTGITAMVATQYKEKQVQNICEVQTNGGLATVEIDEASGKAFLNAPMNKIGDIEFCIKK